MPIVQQCSLLLYAGHPGLCHRCGRPLTGRQSRWCGKGCEDHYWNQHYWPVARKLALKRDKWRCVDCGSAENLEVDHINPLMGRGYNSSCAHHVSNLATRCHTCHLAKTAEDMRSIREHAKTPGRGHK